MKLKKSLDVSENLVFEEIVNKRDEDIKIIKNRFSSVTQLPPLHDDESFQHNSTNNNFNCYCEKVRNLAIPWPECLKMSFGRREKMRT